MTVNKKMMLLFSILVLILSFTYIILIPYLGFGTFGGSHEQNHYINVSWHLWQQKDWLQLYDDAGIYINKPPLMFWLVNIVWHIFGINNWVFRLIPYIFAIGSLGLLLKVFQRLWPEYADEAWVCPVILLGSWDFLQYIPRFLLDLPLIFFVIWAFYGLLLALSRKTLGWVFFSLAVGLGILMKGPVVLIFTLTPALLAPFFFLRRTKTSIDQDNLIKKKLVQYNLAIWFKYLSFSLGCALCIVGLWLAPILLRTNFAELINAVLTKSLDLHGEYISKPWWFYLTKLPLALLPWTLWPFLYESLARQIVVPSLTSKKIVKPYNLQFLFIAANGLIIFIIMSLIPAKATRYIAPIYFYFALLFAYSLITNKKEVRQVTRKNVPLLSVIFILAISLLFFKLNISIGEQLLIAIILFCGVVVAWYKVGNTLINSLLSQLLLVYVVVMLYTIFPVRQAIAAHQMPQFEQCVNDYLYQHKQPIAYFYRYGGYLYRVGKGMLPFGAILYNDQQLLDWLQQHPAGLVIATSSIMVFPEKKIICSIPNIPPTNLIAFVSGRAERVMR